MLKFIAPIALIVAVGIAAAAYAVTSPSATERTDCPGKIVCPLTGNLVCKDRCPLGNGATSSNDALPTCCQW